MKKTIVSLLLTLLVYGCGTPMVSGFSKPTIFTIPPSYLDSFPLGSVTKDELISNLGVPDKSSELDGKTYLAYELGEGYGKRQYVFEISNGIVTDVRYHDQGPYNGSSAKKRQNK